MNTDPNPFRESPDSDRSSSSTEAVDDSTRDFAEVDEEMHGAGSSSPMSEEEDSTASTGGENDRSADEAGGAMPPDAAEYEDKRISGEPRPA
jgi:hypothetical protein